MLGGLTLSRGAALWALLGVACVPEFPTSSFPEDPDHDFDRDGLTENEGDCDDENATALPGGEEVCDGADNDCDGTVDEDDAVDAVVWYLDGDRDGFGSANFALVACEAPPGYADNNTDCDDTLSYVNPDEAEVCDGGIDNDCNGRADDNDDGTVGDATWYRDSDGDGWGTDEDTLTQCAAPAGYTLADGDCDDTDRRSFPTASEMCDGADNDCDGFVDGDDPEGVVGLAVWYADADGDGYGDLSSTTEACTPPEGFTGDNRDCDDTDAAINPGAVELCDTADNDCDGFIDEDDAEDAAAWYADADADGYGDPDAMVRACAAPAFHVADDTDCDPSRGSVYPGAEELCATSGIDEDCDGSLNDVDATGCLDFFLDADGDGYGDGDDSQCTCVLEPSSGYTSTTSGDCDDTDSAVNPGALEDCSTPSTDDDCDGDTNDAGAVGCAYYWYDADADGYGDAALSQCLCVADDPYDATVDGDCDETDDAIHPGADELCADAVDNNCDGLTDDGTAIDASTWYLDADADGYGLTTSTTSACDQPSGYTDIDGDCDDTRDGLNPGMTEDCLTTFDDDCSGTTNDVGADACTTFYADVDGDGYGVAADTQCTCEADTSTVYTSRVTEDCDDGDAAVSPGDTETCSTAGVDDDCDGTADNEDADGCTNYFYDFDGDSYGINDYRCLCASTGYYTAATLGDCDDADSTVNPAAANCGLSGAVSGSQAAALFGGRSSSYTTNYHQMGAFSSLDYNRDGITDIVLGSAGQSNTYSNSGAVYLWLGPLSGSHSASAAGDADLIFLDDSLLYRTVGSYVTAGDVDGDGYSEVLVGAGDYRTYGSSSYLIDDGLTGIGTVTPSTAGVTTFSGRKAIVLGDVDADGFDDAWIDGYVAYGSLSGLMPPSTDALSMWCSAEGGTSCLATSGDLDGDGLDEVVASNLSSSPYIDVKVWQAGASWDTTEDWSLTIYANIVRVIGDVDGDGKDDALCSRDGGTSPSDPFTGASMSNVGYAYLFPGGTDSVSGAPALMGPVSAAASVSDAGLRIYGTAANQQLGQDARGVGDVNGDGQSDLMISSYGVYSSATRTTLWYGPISMSGTTIPASDADATFTFGTSVAPAGDVNADGYDDVWLGGSTTYLFHGTPN